MFTGIVEGMAPVTDVARGSGTVSMSLDFSDIGDVVVGGSVAVNGVCLTVTTFQGGIATFDMIGETLGRSNLGEIQPGEVVNVERAMTANGRFDGHIVQGHVDGVGRVAALDESGVVSFDGMAKSLLRYVVEKGSITVDGVSLTVTGVHDSGFAVALIPHTLANTNLGRKTPGDLVNIEVDVLAKYVDRMMQK